MGVEVFCQKCKHLEDVSTYIHWQQSSRRFYCVHPNNLIYKKNWFSEDEVGVMTPQKRNNKNSCLLFENK